MRVSTWRGGTVASAIVLAFLLVLGLLVGPSTSSPDSQSGEGGDSEVILVVAGKGCDRTAVVTQALRNQGFVDGEFVVGADHIQWSEAAANERGEAAFVDETPRSASEVVDQLAADTSEAKAAAEALANQAGTSREALLVPENWVPAQFSVASSWGGNTAYRDGAAVAAGERQSAAGDVAWLFVHPDKCPAAEAGTTPPEDAVTAHRAGCGNPQTALPRPTVPSASAPGSPPPPPGQPTVTTSPPTGGKDHRKASPEVLVQTGPEPTRAPAPTSPPSGGGGSGGPRPTTPRAGDGAITTSPPAPKPNPDPPATTPASGGTGGSYGGSGR